MENKNIVLLKHHPMNVKFSNTFYTNQCSDLNERIVIDVTSRVERDKTFMEEHPTFARDLSPFYIGPITGPDGATSHVFEHFWQCGKVYPCHYKNEKLLPQYFEWRKKWYDKEQISRNRTESRHPNVELGYRPSDCLFFAHFEDGEYKKLNYVEARKKVYIPNYAKLVHNTESFRWLKSLVDDGHKIALVDFDGYNYYEESALKGLYNSYLNRCKKNEVIPQRKEADFLKINSMKKVINCPFLLAGHGFVIKMLLEDDLTFNPDGSLNDPDGFLEVR